MATCLVVITSALKLARVLPSGGSPSTDETTDGMAALQSMYDEWRTSGMFGRLQDVYLTGDDIAEEGKRYFVPTGVTLTEPASVYLASDGTTRQPRDLGLYESLTQAGTHVARVYDRTDWVDLLDLASGDTAPLSSRGSMGLAACLATSGGFAAMFSDTASMNPDVRAMCNRFRTSLSYKLGSTRDRTASEYF